MVTMEVEVGLASRCTPPESSEAWIGRYTVRESFVSPLNDEVPNLGKNELKSRP